MGMASGQFLQPLSQGEENGHGAGVPYSQYVCQVLVITPLLPMPISWHPENKLINATPDPG